MMMEKIVAVAITVAFITGQCQQPSAQAVVAQDGSGNFSTVKDAIAAAPNNNAKQYYIKIKGGTYFENIIIGTEKINIVLVGEGMDKTTISGNRSYRSGYRTKDTSTVEILGNGFMAQGISFENTAGPEMEQAVALQARANNLTFYQCRFKGYQDTLYTAYGNQFFRECEVFGTIDFIFGDSTAVFQNCVILVQRPLPKQYLTITAQSRTGEEQKTGTIFQNCTIIPTQDLRQAGSNFNCYFGRPWRDFSRTVIMQSFIDTIIDPKGWIEWNGQTPVHPFYADYLNRGPGNITSGRANWSTQITTLTQASQFTVRNFLQGGTWIPSTVPRYIDLI